MNRVVITGMGIWSCIGTSLDEVRQSLYDGKSGIIFSQARKDAGFNSALTGNVPRVDLKSYVHRKFRSYMHEESQYAYMATIQALKQANIDQDYLNNNEVGIIYGNDSVAGATIDAIDKIRSANATVACGGGAVFQTINSTASMNLACLFKLKGINLTTSAACTSGSQSIGIAAMLIRNGLQDCIVCGGAEENNLYGIATFDGMQVFSDSENEPEKASRPFDARRNGLIPSGGAATLILESYEHAVRRGAKIIAEIIGWGFSGNGDNISTPNVDGPVRSMETCLRNAGIAPTDIGYVNAHATSTVIGDQREAQAIASVFGNYKVPVTSTKSQTGHEMWMAGASEIIYSILMMKNDFIAGNINFESPDDVTSCLNIIPVTQQTHFNIFMSNSFGFGGTNSTLLIKMI